MGGSVAVADFLAVLLQDGVLTPIMSIVRICLVLIPVMIVIEIARRYKVVEVFSQRMGPFMRLMTLPKEAALPILVALIFGILFGAALIIDYSREGFLKRRDLMLTGVFMCINHSVIEEAIIFSTMGASPLIFLALRMLLAILITRLAAALWDYGDGSGGFKKTHGDGSQMV